MRISVWLFWLLLVILLILGGLFSVNIYKYASLMNVPKAVGVNPLPYLVLNIIGLIIVVSVVIFWLVYSLTGSSKNGMVVVAKGLEELRN